MNNRLHILLVLPGVLLVAVLLVAPLFSLFLDTIPDLEHPFSLYEAFLEKGFHRKIIIRTIRVALITTMICVILAYPCAFFIARYAGRFKAVLIVIAVFPLLLSPVVRSFAWMAILGKNGFFNDLLQFLRIIDEPLQMLYTEVAVIIGLTYLFMPLMILPLVGVIENIEEDLLDSAKSLGAKDSSVFFQIILPLSASGLLVGCILVFTGSLTAYTTPRLIGGDQEMTLSTLIYQNAMTLFEWDAASVIAIIMIASTILVMKIIGSLATRMNPDV